MLSHPHLLRGDTHEMDESRARGADNPEQKRRKTRERIAASRENPNVGPRIEIMLNRQKENLFVSAAIAKLGTIGVFFPTHSTQ